MMVRRAACSGLIDNSFEFLDAKKLKHTAELSAKPMRICAALLYLYRSYAAASGSPLEFLCVDAHHHRATSRLKVVVPNPDRHPRKE
jgi:hypothetical protein